MASAAAENSFVAPFTTYQLVTQQDGKQSFEPRGPMPLHFRDIWQNYNATPIALRQKVKEIPQKYNVIEKHDIEVAQRTVSILAKQYTKDSRAHALQLIEWIDLQFSLKDYPGCYFYVDALATLVEGSKEAAETVDMALSKYCVAKPK